MDELIKAAMASRQRRPNMWDAGTQAISQARFQPSASEQGDWKKPLMFALAQSLASGITGGLSMRQQRADDQDFSNRLIGALRSENPANALAADPELANLGPMVELENYRLQQARQQKEQDLGLQMKYQKGLQMNPQTNQIEPVPGYADATRQMQEASMGMNPAVQNVLAKRYQGAELSPEETQLLASSSPEVQRLAANAQYQSGIQQRFDTNYGFKESEREIPGTMRFSAAIPDVGTVRNLRNKMMATDQISKQFDIILETGDINSSGFFEYFGNDAQLQEAIRGAMMNAQRVSTNSGANFTVTEQKLIDAGLPKLFSNDPVGSFMAWARGQDQRVFASTMKKVMEADRDIALFSQGFKVNNRPISFYPQDLIERQKNDLMRTGLLGEMQQQPQGMSAPTGGGRKVRLRNPETGEETVVSEAEARQMGAIK